jgi:hypothetical protein
MSQISHLFLYPRSPLLFRVGPRLRDMIAHASSEPPGNPAFFKRSMITSQRFTVVAHRSWSSFLARARARSRGITVVPTATGGRRL